MTPRSIWRIQVRDGQVIDCREVEACATDTDDVFYVEARNRAEAGRKVFDNTHFATEREAWERLIAEATAGVRLSGSDVDRLRSAANEAEHRLVQDALNLNTVLEGFERWEREQEGSGRG